jgi:hypothetical protein
MGMIDRCGPLMAVLILASAPLSAQVGARIANASTAGQWWGTSVSIPNPAARRLWPIRGHRT